MIKLFQLKHADHNYNEQMHLSQGKPPAKQKTDTKTMINIWEKQPDCIGSYFDAILNKLFTYSCEYQN